MKYNSVVFDMDGVILDYKGDNFEWQNRAIRKVLEEQGLETGEMTRSEFKKFLGVNGVPGCVDICKEYNVDAATVWERIAEETCKARARKLKEGSFRMFPEVRDVLETLHENDVLLGLISNAPEMAITETIEYYDLKHFFKFYRGIEDFEDLSDRKPHPDHLNFARAELKREPFLYAGDHESDIRAAKNAEMDSVWVNRDESTIDAAPDYKVSSLEEMKSIVVQ